MARRVYMFESHQIFNATDVSEYLVLTAANKALYQLVISQSHIDMADGKNARTALWTLFGEESATRANLAALAPDA